MHNANGRQDHAPSYYAATINDTTEYPALERDLVVDVCVIGGGFSGVAAALTLAERGRSVALLEANRIGWGASGRNGGQVLPGWSGETAMTRQLGDKAREFFRRTRYRGNDIVEERIEKHQIDCDYVRGAMTTAINRRHMLALREEYDDAVAAGYAADVEMIGAEGVRDYVNSEKYIGGLVEKRGAHCHPLNLCLGEARAARNLGAWIFEGSPALAIEYGARPAVVAEGGRIEADHVILAGNAYHALEKKRLNGYLLPAKTYMIATAPLGDELARNILPRNTAVCDANMVLDYFRLTADKRLLFGGRCTYSNRDIIDVEGALAPRMRRIFPQLEGVKIDYAWGGVLGIVLNRAPMLGRLDERVFYIQGYSGHGLNCSHMVGEILADAIDLNGKDAALFESVARPRLPAADLVGGPLLALGMTYYRLRDALGV